MRRQYATEYKGRLLHNIKHRKGLRKMTTVLSKHDNPVAIISDELSETEGFWEAMDELFGAQGVDTEQDIQTFYRDMVDFGEVAQTIDDCHENHGHAVIRDVADDKAMILYSLDDGEPLGVTLDDEYLEGNLIAMIAEEYAVDCIAVEVTKADDKLSAWANGTAGVRALCTAEVDVDDPEDDGYWHELKLERTWIHQGENKEGLK